MTRSFDDAIRQIADVLVPRETLEHQQASRVAIGPDGRVTPEGLRGLRETQDLQWAPAEAGRKRVKVAGNMVIVAAHCATPPSSGDAIVTITQVSAAGSGPSVTLTIPNGQAIAEVAVSVPVRAGAWVSSSVTTANGASGVSTSIVVERQI